MSSLGFSKLPKNYFCLFSNLFYKNPGNKQPGKIFKDVRRLKHHSVRSTDYSQLYIESTPAHTYMDLPLKDHPRDLNNDLFNQLRMGDIGGDKAGIYIDNTYLYPLPQKTIDDYTGYFGVNQFLRISNPNFHYKLRTSFYFRLLTHMLNRIYGANIEQLETLANDAVRSLQKTDKTAWNGLDDIINDLLSTDVSPQPKFFPVERLCKACVPLVNHNMLCCTEDLSKSIYVYLDVSLKKYQPNPEIIRFIDDITLRSPYHQQSTFAMHLASLVQLDGGVLHVDDVYKTTPDVRDFNGYVQCLLNLKHLSADPQIRLELVKNLRWARHRFILSRAGHYGQNDYYVFLRNLVTLTLPGIPELNRDRRHELIEETSYNNIIADIHWYFFTYNDE